MENILKTKTCFPANPIIRVGAAHYLNHLPVIHEAIGGGTTSAEQASSFEGSGGVLFQFEADPPTVTMQVCEYAGSNACYDRVG